MCAALALPLGGGLLLGGWLAATPLPRQARAGGHAFFRGLPDVTNIAHRGASALAPEHSLEAYRLALRHGAQILELDLRSLADGSLVVAHDADLRRGFGLPHRLDELSLPDLRELTRGLGPEPLEGVLDTFPGVRFNLELKDERLAPARTLAKILEQRGAGERVLVASAHHDVLLEFRNVTRGTVATSASAREALRFCACYRLGVDCQVPFSALQVPVLSWLGLDEPELVAHAHAAGVAVHYFTIDDALRMQRLVRAGADGIMTNRPDRLRQVLESEP